LSRLFYAIQTNERFIIAHNNTLKTAEKQNFKDIRIFQLKHLLI